MRQVLFRIPPWSEDGLPVYGFGLMLFVSFLACTWIAGKRAEKEGIAKQIVQDLAVWLFVGGLIGARLVFMIQDGSSFWPPWNFFKIWQGGLVFYGSAIGGMVAFVLAYYFMVKKHGVGLLQMLDIAAPAVALGLCLGRIGCLLNGCCYGHVACTSCPAIEFPLSAPPRQILVKAGYQTAAGFTLTEQPDGDPLSLVGQVEPGSPAAEAGLRGGDVIVGVDGKLNQRILEVKGRREVLERVAGRIGEPHEELGGDAVVASWQYVFEDPNRFRAALKEAEKFRPESVGVYDSLWDTLARPRGKTTLELQVRRGKDQLVQLSPFAPRTLGLHPTQVYETISTALLFFVLCAYTPLRHRYGEVFVLLLFGYAIHRFINEQLRNDTDPITIGRFETHLTLSQNLSILALAIAVIMAIVVWRRPADVRKA